LKYGATKLIGKHVKTYKRRYIATKKLKGID
jgi:hypothetical protein